MSVSVALSFVPFTIFCFRTGTLEYVKTQINTRDKLQSEYAWHQIGGWLEKNTHESLPPV